MRTVALHHILLKSQWLAEDLLAELQLGADFEDLANEYSSCPSATHQGFAGFHSIDKLPEPLVQALFNQENTNLYIGPVKTEHGFHIIKRMDIAQRSMLLDN